MLAGDFNLIRSLENISHPGGSQHDMLAFNDLIQHLDLVDIPFIGKEFTWSNMQENALLEKLDWVFTSGPWGLRYPDTRVIPLARPISDHVPFVIRVNTIIPRAKIFGFENFWAEFSGFMEIVELHWNSNPIFANPAKTIAGKFKQLRKGIKAWSKSLSNLTRLIHNTNWVLAILDGLEDHRPFCRVEKKFRKIVKWYRLQLLESKRKYWR